YFTDLSNSGTDMDQLNQRNTQDPGARSSFYGISDVPSDSISGDASVVDVNEGNAFTSVKAQLAKAKLDEPGFNIALNATVDANNDLIVNADFTAASAYDANDEIGLFIAIVEPQITLAENLGNYTAGETIENVLRKLLPSAAGQYNKG